MKFSWPKIIFQRHSCARHINLIYFPFKLCFSLLFKSVSLQIRCAVRGRDCLPFAGGGKSPEKRESERRLVGALVVIRVTFATFKINLYTHLISSWINSELEIYKILFSSISINTRTNKFAFTFFLSFRSEIEFRGKQICFVGKCFVMKNNKFLNAFVIGSCEHSLINFPATVR